ncbi:DNA primase [hydrothermal vent metagenome]|uniref:DNA primase n=1 Tax=hydrothermal vent metagenome TaxID=652676 RepID=A0A3B0Z157_9ZZZZ
MAGRIPQAFIDDLIARVDIVDVIDRRVQLQKKGREYQACCPFHTEKTPSFTVSQVKQFYHCFGCGAHGTAIGFMMEYEHMEFIDTIETLAAELGIEVPYEQTSHSSSPNLSPLYEAMNTAVDYYQQQLKSHAASPSAVDYLKQRGITGEIAKHFLLGFAPPGWNNLSDQVSNTPQCQAMVSAGIISQKDNADNAQYYDRFRHRIMFPIRDKRGRPIAFGGRVIDSEDNPKYLNSPETPVFHKGNELYGLYEARQSIRHLERFMVVEGYMDVLALAQNGIQYAVATLGTAPNEQHLKILFRLVKDIVFCFDGDKAGRKAAWRALEHSLPLMMEGRQVSFLFLPDGEDPDSLVRAEGQQAFEARINQAMPLSDFLIKHIEQNIDSSTTEGNSRIAELAKPLVQKLPDNMYRELMVKKIADRVGLESDLIIKNLDLDAKRNDNSMNNNKNTTRPQTGINQNFNNPQKNIARTPVRLAIAILLQNPEYATNLNNAEALIEVNLPGMSILVEMIEFCHSKPNVTTAAFLERWRDTPAETHLGKLSHFSLPGDEESIKNEFIDVIEHLINLRTDNGRRAFLEQKHSTERLTDAEKLEYNQILMGITPDKP